MYNFIFIVRLSSELTLALYSWEGLYVLIEMTLLNNRKIRSGTNMVILCFIDWRIMICQRLKLISSPPNLISIAFWAHHSLTIQIILGFIVKNTKSTYSRVCIGICSIFTPFVSPILRYNNLVNRSEYIHFKLTISLGGGCKTWRGIYLDQPRFAGIIY